MISATEIHRMSRQELAELLQGGQPIDPEAIADREFKGTSLGLPGIVEKLTWKKFKKVFCRDQKTGALRGWNVRLEQNGLQEPCVPLKLSGGRPKTFGHYQVLPLSGYRPPLPVPHGLMLDYGRGGNKRHDPAGRLRDPIVALERGNAELLLGWTYLDLGLRRVGTPSYFTLELDGPLTHRVLPPRQFQG